MRDIKFRAWDVEKKCMILWDEIADDWGMAIFSYPKEILVMQYTGLHDKNGKEIWEGDILRDEYSHPLTVVWGKYGWCIQYVDLGEKHTDQIDDDLFDAFELEVIGNIYETKISPNLPGKE
jgi:uncharacterized phage protein (TIGR01671 family)